MPGTIHVSGVQSMSVVEKGSWDEFLPLEGGGHVHMKLQFVLSEEERSRIRIMRESAMKKKSGDLLKSLETASTAGGIVSSSLRINHEVSDHTRRLCITTGSKQLMDLVGGCGIEEWTHKVKKSISLPENVEEFGNYTEVNKGNKTSHEPRKSRLESSAEVETSTGAVGQAMKIAIMVAFGTLVLVTRQRKPR